MDLIRILVLICAAICLSTIAAYSPDLDLIWSTREIPYLIDVSISDDIKELFLSASEEISRRTCVKFRERKPTDPDYLRLRNNYECETDVGRQGGVQNLDINTSCSRRSDLLHELMHTLGFYHEHQRIDRDSYITVNATNIISRFAKNFVERSSLADLDLPYDYWSITHYTSTAYSKNDKPVIVTKNSSYMDVIGHQTQLSEIDVQKIKSYYNCYAQGVVCSLLSAPVNGRVNVSHVYNHSSEVGSIGVYIANSGYTRIGPESRLCQADGTWSAYQPVFIQSDTVIHYCSFTPNIYDWCGWSRTKIDGENVWFQSNIKTFYSETGPHYDHTNRTSNGRFAYVDSSRGNNSSFTSLTSPQFNKTGLAYFRFSYHMYGVDTGSLEVNVILDSGSKENKFKVSGDQGDEWKTHSFTINTQNIHNTYQIEYIITLVGGVRGDIAIDDLLLTSSPVI